MAACADKTTLVKFLLARGADPNRNLRGEIFTALECAAYSASIPTLTLLLDASAQIKTRSALTTAAYEGRTDVVAYLLDRGADVDEVPDNENIYDNAGGLGLGMHYARRLAPERLRLSSFYWNVVRTDRPGTHWVGVLWILLS